MQTVPNLAQAKTKYNLQFDSDNCVFIKSSMWEWGMAAQVVV